MTTVRARPLWRYPFDFGAILEPQPGPGDSWFIFFRCICPGAEYAHHYHVHRLEQRWEVVAE